jgi:hypothetical protein
MLARDLNRGQSVAPFGDTHAEIAASLRRSVAVVALLTLAGCAEGAAHRVRGTDMAIPVSSGGQLLAALLRQCEISRVPASTADETKRKACTRPDTAAGQPGAVGRVPVGMP